MGRNKIMDQVLSELRRFDAREAVRLRHTQSGVLPLGVFSRLLEGLPEDQPGSVHWSVRGLQGPLGQDWLELELHSDPNVECQRCLQPYTLELDSMVRLELVATDEEAEADIDDEADDELEDEIPVDKVVCTGRLDLLEQIEDELILSIPYITRHDSCEAPEGIELSAAEETGQEERQRPFLGLEVLKSRLRKSDDTDS